VKDPHVQVLRCAQDDMSQTPPRHDTPVERFDTAAKSASVGRSK
jgi:hypothetical protein